MRSVFSSLATARSAQKLELLDERLRSVAVMPRLTNRDEVAQLARKR